VDAVIKKEDVREAEAVATEDLGFMFAPTKATTTLTPIGALKMYL
jgi:hypothetical protein